MQAFLTTPKYNKFYIYKSPQINTRDFAMLSDIIIWHKLQEEIESKIQEYLAAPIPIQGFLQNNHSRPGPSQVSRPA
ncbi:13656_t:CDS:2 [Funneliformis caledonium]|uniref:13656_t:CDS:1 n=1 Tax=Funneliformis caledonium TaxID=1117310 RepID=A0A9N9E3I6_9GLOM|nr:13656_t:CDS:2 [Funneliformis caledonium]